MKIHKFCTKCNLETDHDHEEYNLDDTKQTINVCCICGNVDLDFDPIENEFYFDDDYEDLEYN